MDVEFWVAMRRNCRADAGVVPRGTTSGTRVRTSTRPAITSCSGADSLKPERRWSSRGALQNRKRL